MQYYPIPSHSGKQVGPYLQYCFCKGQGGLSSAVSMQTSKTMPNSILKVVARTRPTQFYTKINLKKEKSHVILTLLFTSKLDGFFFLTNFVFCRHRLDNFDTKQSWNSPTHQLLLQDLILDSIWVHVVERVFINIQLYQWLTNEINQLNLELAVFFFNLQTRKNPSNNFLVWPKICY